MCFSLEGTTFTGNEKFINKLEGNKVATIDIKKEWILIDYFQQIKFIRHPHRVDICILATVITHV